MLLMGQSFEERVTSVSNVGLTVNNLGSIGNAFRGDFNLIGSPSCEYPVNSGVEHAFQGGLWVGALINGGVTAVSTGYLDAPSGYSTGGAGFEFTAEIGDGITERSNLLNSSNFSPFSVSQQDFISDFTDKNITVPGTNNIQILGHENPLGIDVHMEAYNWNFSFVDFFVALDLTIVNNGVNRLDSVYVGYLVNGVVRNVNLTPPGGGVFYSQGGNGYLDTLFMSYDFDATGDVGFTDSYLGEKFLGSEDKEGFKHPELDSTFNLYYQAWFFRNTSSLLFSFPDTEQKRYNKMTQGLNTNPCWEFKSSPECIAYNGGVEPPQSIWDQMRVAGNRSNLISVGPFVSMEPGDTVKIALAMVFAPMSKDNNSDPNTNLDLPSERKQLIQNSEWAQTAYCGEDVNCNGILDPGEDIDGDGKITRWILPNPPSIPISRVVARDKQIDIYWSDNAESSIDPISGDLDFEGYRIYQSILGFDVQDKVNIASSLTLLASFDIQGNKLFFDNGFEAIRLADEVTFEGDTNEYNYLYTINNIQNGWQNAISVASFDRGDRENGIESLESSPIANVKRVFPGKPANESLEENEPFVYPNPYYAGAAWEGSSTFAEDKKMTFSNLPANCVVRIFSQSGDLIDQFTHDQNYNGSDIKWFSTYADPKNNEFSGGEHSWDLLSKSQQIIARGLYLFSVEDLKNGKIYQGTFAVIK
jgi:hypothetical protein